MCLRPHASTRLWHPVLNREIEVPTRAVRIYERSGWQPIPPPTSKAKSAAKKAAMPPQIVGDPVDVTPPTAGESTESPHQEV